MRLIRRTLAPYTAALFASSACIAPAPSAAPIAQTSATAPVAPGSASAASPLRIAPGGCADSRDAASFDFSRLRLEGRSEPARAQGLGLAWSGTSIRARFSGTAVQVDLADSGKNRYYAYLDDKLLKGKLSPESGRHCYELSTDGGEHELELYRLTEPLLGESTLFGITVAGGALTPPSPASQRRLEIIGDSISAAYGVEGESRDCHFSSDTENHALSYGAIVAERFAAELSTVAWSGKGVFSNRGSTTDTVPMPVLWERALPERAESRWDFARFQPDAVIIALGTNDFAPETPDKSPFGAAYLSLVQRVRQAYPRAYVFCVLGPMLNDAWPPNTRARSTAREQIQKAVSELERGGDQRVLYFEHAPSSDAEGWGCDWHPNRQTHRRMADELAPALTKALGW